MTWLVKHECLANFIVVVTDACSLRAGFSAINEVYLAAIAIN